MRKVSYRAIFRHFSRNKTITLIKIAGLAIGICISLVVFLAVSYEFSFDRKHRDSERIYRVVSRFGEEPNLMHLPGVPMPMPSVLKSEVAGIQLVAPILLMGGDLKITVPDHDGTAVYEGQSQVVYADSGFFRMFSYDWLSGDPATALNEPYRAVLTRSAAAHYFPRVSANNLIGKTIGVRDSVVLTVAGIVDDPAQNSDLNFRMFISLETAKTRRLKHPLADHWVATIPSSQVYIKLEKNADPVRMQSQLDQLYMRYGYVEVPGFKPNPPYRLQPLSDIHFNNLYFPYFGNPQANKTLLYGLMLVAVFMLVLGVINFVTLTTAQAEQRGKEVGIRRSMGGSKYAIFSQFFAEAIIVTAFAVILAIALVPLTMIVYREWLPAQLSFRRLSDLPALLFVLLVFVIVAFGSGFYTSIRMSRIDVMQKLRGTSADVNTASFPWVRKSLILIQFVISQILIIGSVFVGLQLQYTANKDRGFRNDGVIFYWMSAADTAATKRQVIQQELLRIPGVTRVSFANAPMASKPEWTGKINFIDGKSPVNIEVQCKYVDSNFLSLYEVPIRAGRNLNTVNPMNECVINETMARSLGYTQMNQIIGKQINFGDDKIVIAGVAKDFHFQSLHIPIKPLMILSKPENLHVINVAISEQVMRSKTALSNLSAGVRRIAMANGAKPGFEFEFQEEVMSRFYADDRKVSFLLRSFTIMTVFVSCIGLFGLSVFSTQRRQKEMSIRKVLGASVNQIIRLFTKEFIVLVVIAFLIAVPVTYVFVRDWLNQFSYRIPMSWWIFAMAGLISFVIVVATIAMQSLKVAMSNPANTLRSE